MSLLPFDINLTFMYVYVHGICNRFYEERTALTYQNMQ